MTRARSFAQRWFLAGRGLGPEEVVEMLEEYEKERLYMPTEGNVLKEPEMVTLCADCGLKLLAAGLAAPGGRPTPPATSSGEIVLSNHEEERLERLYKRIGVLESRIADADFRGRDLTFDKAELSALRWVIEKIDKLVILCAALERQLKQTNSMWEQDTRVMATQIGDLEIRLKQAEEERDRHSLQVTVLLGNREDLTAECDAALARAERMKEAITWVVRDALYKAPEQIDAAFVRKRFIPRLTAALAPASDKEKS